MHVVYVATISRNCPEKLATQNVATVYSIGAIKITKIFPIIFDSFFKWSAALLQAVSIGECILWTCLSHPAASCHNDIPRGQEWPALLCYALFVHTILSVVFCII